MLKRPRIAARCETLRALVGWGQVCCAVSLHSLQEVGRPATARPAAVPSRVGLPTLVPFRPLVSHRPI